VLLLLLLLPRKLLDEGGAALKAPSVLLLPPVWTVTFSSRLYVGGLVKFAELEVVGVAFFRVLSLLPEPNFAK
jgi:hypothetical protein